MKKYRFLITLSLAVVLAAICFFVFPTGAKAAVIDSGTCGDNVTWTLDDTGTLIISGTGAMYNYIDAPGKGSPFSRFSNIKTILIEDGVTSIGAVAFATCSVEEIVIPNSVVRIGGDAFTNCDNLQTVVIPDSVEIIEGSFAYCDNLACVELGKNLKTIGGMAFLGCRNLMTMSIPEGVTCIGDFAFAKCEQLNLVSIPVSVTTVSNCAFSDCYSLSNVYFDGTLKQWSEIYIEYGNDLLLNASIQFGREENNIVDEGDCGDNVTWVLDESGTLILSGTGDMWNYEYGPGGNISPFSWMNAKMIIIEDGVTSIGKDAFTYCESVTNVSISESVTSIGQYAFSSCTGLTEIVIPNGVTTIDGQAFYQCTNLASVTIPDSITAIDLSAFQECSNLTYNIYDNARYLGNAENPYYYLFQSISENIVSCDVHENTKIIGQQAFRGCRSLIAVDIPDSVTNIGSYAFAGCNSLSNVFYGGSQQNWDNIYIGSDNSWLQNATLHLQVEQKQFCNGNYIYCPACNKYYTTTGTEVTHSFTNYVSNNNATCTADGSETAKCDRCDVKNTRVEEGSQLGHSFTNYKSNNNATCTADGTETAKCDRCTAEKTRIDEGSAGHKHQDVVTAPTCTEQGYTTHTCICGDSYVDSHVPALEHSFTNYVSNNDATYEADGTKTAKCDRCEETDTITDPGTKLEALNGWIQENGKWYYYEDNAKKTGWLNTNGVWYYMDAAGVMQTGWKQVNGHWYFFESNGVMATNAWKKDSKGWCYLGANGAMRTNAWVQDSKGWCYVDASGYCLTNQWAKDSKGWIWLDSEGSMTKSKWIQYNGAWYYLDSEGYMATGWAKVNNTWYYLGTNGAMQTGWVQLGNVWYYLHDSGVMATGTVKIGAKTYTFASNGVWVS